MGVKPSSLAAPVNLSEHDRLQNRATSVYVHPQVAGQSWVIGN